MWGSRALIAENVLAFELFGVDAAFYPDVVVCAGDVGALADGVSAVWCVECVPFVHCDECFFGDGHADGFHVGAVCWVVDERAEFVSRLVVVVAVEVDEFDGFAFAVASDDWHGRMRSGRGWG